MDRPIAFEARTVELTNEPSFVLGRARIDPEAREYVIGSRSSRLQPQALRVLIALHDKSGRVVSRDELIDRCWSGRIVGDDVINRCISLLRQFAAESGGFRIETISRAGYRLVEEPVRAAHLRRRWLAAGSAAALAGLVAGALLIRSESKTFPTLTIALLPFTADSRDADMQTLAFGSHDAVANALAQGAYSIRVMDSPPQGDQPRSDFLISGRLTGNSEKTVVTVQMEETAHQIVVFSHQFEASRETRSTLPDEVGAQVAAQLSWTAPLVALEQRHPSDPAVARQLFEESATGLSGSGHLADYENSRRLALAAPNSPLAQMDLAYDTAFALDQLPLNERENAVELARRASDRAIALAPESGEPYAPWCMLHSEARSEECEKRLRKAMRVDPGAPFAAWFLASLVLKPVGRNAEAAELASVSLAHDPYMPNKIGLAVEMLEATGRTAAAQRLYSKSTIWWPGKLGIVWRRFAGMVERGDFQAAKRFNDETRAEPDAAPVLLAATRDDVALLRTACARTEDIASIICMVAFARSGDLNSAFALADRLYPPRRRQGPIAEDRLWIENPKPSPVEFLTGPAAAPLRRDARFLRLAYGLGLLDYWRSGRMPDFCTQAREPECSQIERR